MHTELIDLSYAAGFIEADGCFHITSSSVSIRVTNKNTTVLDWFKETFGGTINSKTTPINCWEWNLHGEKAADLCSLLLPLLKFKRPEAECLISFQETIGPRGRKITSQTRDYRDELRIDLKRFRKVRANAC